MELKPMMLPLHVADPPTRLLPAPVKRSAVEAVRKSGPSVSEQVRNLRIALGENFAKGIIGNTESAAVEPNKLDLYDWFFLVERIDVDSDVAGLEALVHAMSDYSELLGSREILTELEEVALAEAIQSIVENYGDEQP